MIKKRKTSFSKVSLFTFKNIFLYVMCAIWLVPIIWLLLQSFREFPTGNVAEFWPQNWTFQNYILLFTEQSAVMNFGRWFLNTLVIAIITCVMTTLFVLSIAYVLSRYKFKLRKPYMNIALILGMFPGFLTMIALFVMLSNVGLLNGFWHYLALPIVYSSGAGIGFFMAKGFFDTIPNNLDEAARIDGASNARVFFTIILPLSKPIIIFTILTSFLGPWADFMFAGYVIREVDFFTVAVGLYNIIITPASIDQFFTRFAAGSVIVGLPTALLFIFLQRFYVGGVTGGAVKG
ncbi:MAG: ABC transporter permease subunit [Firmicutes bacterium]|nr:ABC transporter permease subunit [Bacillota bacterium]